MELDPLSSQSPRTCFESSTNVKIYSSYYIFFGGKFFPKQYHALNTIFKLLQMPKIEIYFANAVMMVNVFKYLPKSEAAVYKCSLKRLF